MKNPLYKPVNRRDWIAGTSAWLAGVASSSLDSVSLSAAIGNGGRTAVRKPAAKSVIYLYMEGGPSQMDTFDPKPRLDRDHGKPLPFKTPNTVFNIGKTVLKSPFEFQQFGQSGAAVSEIFPEISGCVDDLTIIRSMHHGISNHSSACYMSHTGYSTVGKPSMGAWIHYALGSDNDSLPGFVVLDCGQGPSGGAPSWGAGFLPLSNQGTLFTKNPEPLDYIVPLEKSASLQLSKIQAIRQLNRMGRDSVSTSGVSAYGEAFDQAVRMQGTVPELVDLKSETKAMRRLYGMDEPVSELFGSRCLMARRLVERGVRFIEVFPPKVKADRWDQHSNLEVGHRRNAVAVDRPIAGLLKDLKARGLLEDTIVLWGGEFGRTPNAQGSNGRDHNPYGYTVWAAGGGFRPGIQYGATDEFGYFAIDNKVHLHDLHATILHQLGLDHEKLTYRFSGRDYRLTDVGGDVVQDLLL
jgi:hypothetical protein